MTATPIQTTELMIDAWQRLDWDAVTNLFTPDGQLVIVPARATHTGHTEIRAHLDEVAGGIESLSFDVHYLGAAGNMVTFERDDVFVYNGKAARVPVAGILEMEGARVRVWREYFDGYTMLKAMGKV